MVLIIHNGDGEKAIGDYDGDGKNDPATFANGGGGVGQFKVTLSGGGTMTENFGTSDDTVVTGDYDGDGKTDFAVLRPDGPLLRWDYDPSSEPGITVVSDTWGLVESDLPVPGDYTGDGKWDYAVWREASQGEFFIMTPITRSIFRKPWGLGGDTPAAFVLVPHYL